MSGQKLKHVGPRERTAIQLATSSNRRALENFRRQQAQRQGPGACTWCGAEPCGGSWTRPGEPEPGGERCCAQCDHEPVEGWQHTHTAFAGKGQTGQAFPLCALVMKAGEVVYLRRDGMAQFIELRTPSPGSAVGGEVLDDIPSVAFLGRHERHLSLHVAGEGAETDPDLWDNRAELDPLWLPVRMQAAVARDVDRRERRRRQRQEREEAHDRKVAALIAQEEADRQASIDRRQLQHETRIVMDEIEVDDSDAAEEALSMPALSPLVTEAELAEAQFTEESADVTTPAAPVMERIPAGDARLKAPAPVKKGPGRPKRSLRQRRARERQKRAWARQEAKSRLEVKRLERAARATTENVIGEGK